jgi:hypothetical protein
MTDSAFTAGADPAYREALLERLGDADPIAELSALFERLPEALDGIDERTLRTPEREGKWSVLQVVEHLADVEWVQGMRIRRTLVEENPRLTAMDQDRWAERLWGPAADIEDVLDTLRALRIANLRLATSLTDAELDRPCVHPERGDETVRIILRLVAAHDRVHLDQIARIRAALAD